MILDEIVSTASSGLGLTGARTRIGPDLAQVRDPPPPFVVPEPLERYPAA